MQFYNKFCSQVSAIFIVIGILGNAVAVLILHRPNIRSAFNELLIALCIFDTIFLVASITSSIEALGLKGMAPKD